MSTNYNGLTEEDLKIICDPSPVDTLLKKYSILDILTPELKKPKVQMQKLIKFIRKNSLSSDKKDPYIRQTERICSVVKKLYGFNDFIKLNKIDDACIKRAANLFGIINVGKGKYLFKKYDKGFYLLINGKISIRKNIYVKKEKDKLTKDEIFDLNSKNSDFKYIKFNENLLKLFKTGLNNLRKDCNENGDLLNSENKNTTRIEPLNSNEFNLFNTNDINNKSNKVLFNLELSNNKSNKESKNIISSYSSKIKKNYITPIPNLKINLNQNSNGAINVPTSKNELSSLVSNKKVNDESINDSIIHLCSPEVKSPSKKSKKLSTKRSLKNKKLNETNTSTSLFNLNFLNSNDTNDSNQIDNLLNYYNNPEVYDIIEEEIYMRTDGFCLCPYSLIYESKHIDSIYCIEESNFIVLNKEEFIYSFSSALNEANDDRKKFLEHNLYPIHTVNETSLNELFKNSKPIVCGVGDILFKEGETAKKIYIVFSSNFTVHKKYGDKNLKLLTVNKGGIVGLESIFDKNNMYKYTLISECAGDYGIIFEINLNKVSEKFIKLLKNRYRDYYKIFNETCNDYYNKKINMVETKRKNSLEKTKDNNENNFFFNRRDVNEIKEQLNQNYTTTNDSSCNKSRSYKNIIFEDKEKIKKSLDEYFDKLNTMKKKLKNKNYYNSPIDENEYEVINKKIHYKNKSVGEYKTESPPLRDNNKNNDIQTVTLIRKIPKNYKCPNKMFSLYNIKTNFNDITTKKNDNSLLDLNKSRLNSKNMSPSGDHSNSLKILKSIKNTFMKNKLLFQPDLKTGTNLLGENKSVFDTNINSNIYTNVNSNRIKRKIKLKHINKLLSNTNNNTKLINSDLSCSSNLNKSLEQIMFNNATLSKNDKGCRDNSNDRSRSIDEKINEESAYYFPIYKKEKVLKNKYIKEKVVLNKNSSLVLLHTMNTGVFNLPLVTKFPVIKK